MASAKKAAKAAPVKTGKATKPRAKTGPQKAKDTDETSRISEHPSANEAGPAEESKGKTSDERGQVKPATPEQPEEKEITGKPHTIVKPEGERHSAGEAFRDVHGEAAQQAGRDTHRPTGVQEIKVDGERIQTVSTPGKLDPQELKPSKRDTVVKDQLRADGKAEHADAPRREVVGGDWHDTDVRADADDGPKGSGAKRKVAE